MRGSRLLLFLLSITSVRSDIFHHYHLKKFLTYVAFARAMVRRPTILPVPIPIPIPISQNEVIKLPASSAKSFLTLANGHSHSLGGRSEMFTGSSNFGYSLPGSFDSGSTSLGGSNIMVLDSNSISSNFLGGADDFASPSNVVRLVSRKPQFLRFPRPIYLSRGKHTMRNSEQLHVQAPLVQNFGGESFQVQIPKQKKPIPVGERFRLP